jgi:hypothetical protein
VPVLLLPLSPHAPSVTANANADKAMPALRISRVSPQ